MPANQPSKLDPEAVSDLYAAYSGQVRRFLIGLLRDESLADDVLQNTFIKAAEHGHTASGDKQKAWLFRVAYNEAAQVRRRMGVGDRVLKKAAWTVVEFSGAAHEPVVQKETIEQIREQIERLPPAQKQIVQLRIYEDKTFAAIAEQLNIPLGTALSRMRAALAKLREKLKDETL